MKRILQSTLILALALAAGRTAMAQLELLPSTPTDTYFHVSHPESGVVYLTGGHAVYKSYDNGESWETCYTYDTAFPTRFFGAWFLDSLAGYATCTKSGKNPGAHYFYDNSGNRVPSLPWLFKTVDGGITWQRIDTAHWFVNIQFVSQDTLFALESADTVDEGKLYKSVDGGHSWMQLSVGDEKLDDYSVVNGNVIYALHGCEYFHEWGFNNPAQPVVYKSVDGGMSWSKTNLLDTIGNKGPLVMDQIYFYEDGKGAIYGHDNVFTDNDFETYEVVGSGFSSFPDCWNFQNSTLKNGFQIATSWDHFHVDGYSRVLISRDFGRHRKHMTFLNSDNPLGYLNNVCNLDGCEYDSTFFITILSSYGGKLFRAKGADFPNVSVPARPEISCSVLPNPFSSQFTLACEIPFNRVEVYASSGRLVQTAVCDEQRTVGIQADSWPAGVYLLKIYTEKGVIVEKIVKS